MLASRSKNLLVGGVCPRCRLRARIAASRITRGRGAGGARFFDVGFSGGSARREWVRGFGGVAGRREGFVVRDDVEIPPETEDGPEYITTADLNDDLDLLHDLRRSQMGDALAAQDEAADDDGDTQRIHPLTAQGQFGTSPRTLPLPPFADAVAELLAGTSGRHLSEAAHRIFGGVGLPYSTSTPTRAKTMQQKPIALDAAQGSMSEMDGDVFLATLVPGIHASVTSVLVETRKRLGSEWAEGLVDKAGRGDLRILDAGGAGAGVLAVRELLRAEWERMHEATESGTALARADGRVGGPGATPPLGSATVLAASDALRRRAATLLENTTFVPRLPDYLHTEDAKKKGKFDLIVAPHTLWPLREDHLRKAHLDNLWSMLSTDGGVLVLLEKGVARGFEMVAAARQTLLNSRIASPGAAAAANEQRLDREESSGERKERGAIIAPCTNHASCPMYKPQGLVKGRRDICHFSQRYVRPATLQRILGARDKNYEDVKFSYLAVMRGRDVRADTGVVQDDDGTDAAFEGHGNDINVNTLTLPRAVLPPLKRRGHVILDLCTPAGRLERWTVPRSFGQQAFRDARKSSWGDLWALGAKTRVPRHPKVKKRDGDLDEPTEPRRKGKRARADEVVVDVDAEGALVARVLPAGEGGRMRVGKIKGVRDKRDKKADGRGRRRKTGGEEAD